MTDLERTRLRFILGLMLFVLVGLVAVAIAAFGWSREDGNWGGFVALVGLIVAVGAFVWWLIRLQRPGRRSTEDERT